MREIKFRCWDMIDKKMCDSFGILDTCWMMQKDNVFTDKELAVSFILMQYTGLKDKNNLTQIYECDILDVDGNVIGNIFENKELLDETEDVKDPANIIISGLGTASWCTTHYVAISRGCTDAE